MSENGQTEGFGVLHVVEPGWSRGTRAGGSDAALVACAAHRLTGSLGAGDVCVAGSREAVRSVHELGIEPIGVVPVQRSPLGRPARLGAPSHHGAELLWHAGTRGCAARGVRTVLRAVTPPPPALLRRAHGCSRVEVFTEQDRLAWARSSIGARAVKVPDFAPLAERLAPGLRAARTRLGVDDTVMLCPIGDRPGDIDGRQFGFLLGLLAVSGRRVSGLMPRDALHAPLARRHINGLHEPCRVFESVASTLALVGIADLALVPPAVEAGSGADVIITRWCGALGVPVVRWGQLAPGKLRHTPGLAGPVIEGIERVLAARASSTIAG